MKYVYIATTRVLGVYRSLFHHEIGVMLFSASLLTVASYSWSWSFVYIRRYDDSSTLDISSNLNGPFLSNTITGHFLTHFMHASVAMSLTEKNPIWQLYISNEEANDIV